MFTKASLRQLIIPLILEQLLAMTVGLAAVVMITAVGEAAVSGVSLVDSVNVVQKVKSKLFVMRVKKMCQC